MSFESFQWVYLAVAVLLANLPWLSQRCFLVLQCAEKKVWMRLLEWLVLYLIVGGMGYLLEQRLMGTTHTQIGSFMWSRPVCLWCLHFRVLFTGIFANVRCLSDTPSVGQAGEVVCCCAGCVV